MKQAGLNPLDGEVENIYRLLTDEDVITVSRSECGIHATGREFIDGDGCDCEGATPK